MLRKWLKGEVGIKEERQLEELAKEDSFLADALEGYRSMPEKNHLKATTKLKAKLRNRRQKRKRAAGFYRIAAAIAFLIIASAGFWFLNRPSPTADNIAQIEQLEAEESPSTDEKVMKQKESGLLKQEEENSIVPTEPAASIRSEAKERQVKPTTESPIPSLKSKKELASKPNPSPPINLRKDRRKEEVDAASDEFQVVDGVRLKNDQEGEERTEVNEEEDTVDKSNKDSSKDLSNIQRSNSNIQDALSGRAPGVKPKINRTITGSVKDSNGAPLIGANVLVPGTANGTITDIDGKYELQVDSTANKLAFSYTGYELKSIDIEEKNEIDAVLEENAMALEEVVISGYSKSKKVQETRPKGGWKKLERHIQKNLKYPQAAKENKIEGEVILSFTIGDNGRPENILVTKALGHGCDKEAIRLLETGPKWKPKGGKGNYTIPFKSSDH